MTTKPCCTTLYPWLRGNLGHNLGALTSTDRYALDAAVHIINLYAYTRDPVLLIAFRSVVIQMQSKCRHFAYHAIAHILDWSDRPVIWSGAGLDPIQPGRCLHEPPPRDS